MAELVVKAPDVTRTLLEYDFGFTTGLIVPISIDESAGDSCEDAGDRFVIHIAPKPGIADPDIMTQAEDVVVYKHSLATIHKRTRLQRLMTPEEVFELQQYLHPAPKGVQ